MSDKKRPIIAFTKYSPYMVIDLEKMEDSKGNPLTLKPVTMLCRCGNSKSKPYCGRYTFIDRN
jgi:CDGSH-type Zn-finger protein